MCCQAWLADLEQETPQSTPEGPTAEPVLSRVVAHLRKDFISRLIFFGSRVGESTLVELTAPILQLSVPLTENAAKPEESLQETEAAAPDAPTPVPTQAPATLVHLADALARSAALPGSGRNAGSEKGRGGGTSSQCG